MTNDLIYQSVDEDGFPDDNRGEVRRFRPDDLKLSYPNLFEEALAITGREYIRPGEVARVKRIDRLIKEKSMDPDWVQEKLDWAMKNSSWCTFEKWLTAVLNREAYVDWQKRQNARDHQRQK